MIAQVAREVLYQAWRLGGRIGGRVPARGPERVTLLVPAYHAQRSRNIDPLVRAALRCDIVERVVISNHNPSTRMAEIVTVRDPRVELIDTTVRRGCGHIWSVIAQRPGAFFLVVDDDQLLAPAQITALASALVADPSVPHGLCGGNSDGTYLERCEAEVDVLYNVYAVTREHVATFHRLSQQVMAEGRVTPEEIEQSCDDLVISRTGTGRARIHDAGFLLRCRTGGMPGVAIFREAGFDERRHRCDTALRALVTGARSSEL